MSRIEREKRKEKKEIQGNHLGCYRGIKGVCNHLTCSQREHATVAFPHVAKEEELNKSF